MARARTARTTGGARLVRSAAQVVTTPTGTVELVADLAAMRAGSVATGVIARRAAPAGPVVNALYISDPSDTTTPADGVLVIEAPDGVRWKLQASGVYEAGLWGIHSAAAPEENRERLEAAVAAVSSIGGGEIVLGLGTHEFDIDASTLHMITARPGVTISGLGLLSVIKVKAGAGNYRALFESEDGGLGDASGFTLRDLVIDHNGANNPVASGSDLGGGNRRATVHLRKGHGIRMERVTVTGIRARNTVTIWGQYAEDVTNVWVKDCRFEISGGNSVDYDLSVIYLQGDHVTCTGNTVIGPEAGGNGARTAIELHCSNLVCEGNSIYRMTNGILLAQAVDYSDALGATVGREAANNVVAHNNLYGCLHGIRIYPWGYRLQSWNGSAYQTDHEDVHYAFTGLQVVHNNIHLDRDRWSDLAFYIPQGITLENERPDADDGSHQDLVHIVNLPMRLVQIKNNNIFFLPSELPYTSSDSVGAGFYFRNNAAAVHEELVVQGNIVQGAASNGVQWLISTTGARIEDNDIVDAAQAGAAVSDIYRAGVYLAFSQTDLRVAGNRVTDRQAASTILYGIYAVPSAVAGESRIEDNTLRVADGSVTTNYFGANGNSRGFKVRERRTALPTTGQWGLGAVVTIAAPALGAVAEYVCTTAGVYTASPPVWAGTKVAGEVTGTGTLEDGATSIDVSEYRVYLASNTTPTAITTITGGHDGATRYLITTNGQTTLAPGGNIILPGLTALPLADNTIVCLQRRGSSWYASLPSNLRLGGLFDVEIGAISNRSLLAYDGATGKWRNYAPTDTSLDLMAKSVYDPNADGIVNKNAVAHQADSTAVDVAGLVADFNALLAKLRAADVMAEP